MPNSTGKSPSGPTASGRAAREQPATRTLHEILAQLGITNWDLLICGDGSGSGWKDGCGWAATMVDRATQERRQFFGAMNAGSINLAELMPYLQALTWFHANGGRQRLHELSRPLVVHVLTDSQVIYQQGILVAQMDNPLPKTQEAQWASVRQLSRMGYQMNYHWIPRSTTALNWAADLLAGQSRRGLKNHLVKPLSPEWLTWARGLHAHCESHGPHPMLLEAFKILLDNAASPADQSVQAIAGVGMIDPANGEPISPHLLDPS